MGMLVFTSYSEDSPFAAAFTNVSRVCDEEAESKNSKFRLVATEHIRRMRGGSQAQLFRASDENYYVVKFADNPQGAKTLACDFLGTLLAIRLGLPAQPPRLIEVPPVLIENSDELYIELKSGRVPFCPGTCLGSLYPSQGAGGLVPLVAQVIDFWSQSNSVCLRNVSDCAGIFVFDQWTCNTDTRQLLFWRTFRERLWQISMIDQGRCFNGSRWNFPDSPLWGFHNGLEPYMTKKRFRAFEPWLDLLETKINQSVLQSEAYKIPPNWYGNDRSSLDRLIERLDKRRMETRGLIWDAVSAVSKGLLELSRPFSVARAFTAGTGTKMMMQPNPKAAIARKVKDRNCGSTRSLARSKAATT